jgi:hypothetical protein
MLPTPAIPKTVTYTISHACGQIGPEITSDPQPLGGLSKGDEDILHNILSQFFVIRQGIGQFQ